MRSSRYAVVAEPTWSSPRSVYTWSPSAVLRSRMRWTNAVFRKRATSPTESQTGTVGGCGGTRVGSTAQSAAQQTAYIGTECAHHVADPATARSTTRHDAMIIDFQLERSTHILRQSDAQNGGV